MFCHSLHAPCVFLFFVFFSFLTLNTLLKIFTWFSSFILQSSNVLVNHFSALSYSQSERFFLLCIPLVTTISSVSVMYHNCTSELVNIVSNSDSNPLRISHLLYLTDEKNMAQERPSNLFNVPWANAVPSQGLPLPSLFPLSEMLCLHVLVQQVPHFRSDFHTKVTSSREAFSVHPVEVCILSAFSLLVAPTF